MEGTEGTDSHGNSPDPFLPQGAQAWRRVTVGQPSSDPWIRLIALFKLVKGTLLFAAGVGALKLLHRDIAEVAQRWIDVLRVDPDNLYIHSLFMKLSLVNDRTLKEISAGTFAYAGVFLTEGTGLLLRKRWAQYFTVIVTASFLPLEIYELAKHVTIAKILVISLNIAIVLYLAFDLRHR